MEIITFDHKVYQDLNDKIERIADYVFRKETNPRQEPEIWLTSEELADLLKVSVSAFRYRGMYCQTHCALPSEHSGGFQKELLPHA